MRFFTITDNLITTIFSPPYNLFPIHLLFIASPEYSTIFAALKYRLIRIKKK
jgi:hypothetical protein